MKALALVSGGLDSILAARLIQEQGVEVVPLYFRIPFCPRAKSSASPEEKLAALVNAALGREVRTVDIQDEFLQLLRKPLHGFGANLNPCIDCKILMLRRARGLLEAFGASFVVTGEVVGQRPMSQHRQALAIIERESGLEGLLVRPLSAKILDPTLPETRGWLKRDGLLDFNGRTRKPQIALARAFGITDFPNAAGGCLLTDPCFARKLKDLIQSGAFTSEDIQLLKVGRHFRLSPAAKLVVGRDEGENGQLLASAREGDYLFYPVGEMAGPTSLGRGEFNPGLIALACAVTCRYCDLQGLAAATILYRRVPGPEETRLETAPLAQERLKEICI